MLWALRKNILLKKVNDSITKLRNDRSVKHAIVIDIIEQCIANDPDKCEFNPMNSAALVSHILSNFWIMDLFPEHKKLILIFPFSSKFHQPYHS